MGTRRFALVLIDVALLIVLGLYTVAGLQRVPFHGDEATFVHVSRDYHTLVHQGDPDRLHYRRPLWRSELQYLRMMNGTVNPYSIGLAWDLAGYTVDDLNLNWEWIEEPNGPWEQWGLNIRAGNKPAAGLLTAARIPSTLFTVLSIILVYAIARGLAGWRVAGWTAALIYATTPAVLLNGRRAMQEGSVLFSTALVMLIALWVIREQEHPDRSWRRLLTAYLGLGAAGGLAIASKHSAAVIVAVAFLVVAALPWMSYRAGRSTIDPAFLRRHKYSLGASFLLAMLVAILLMPAWWSPGYVLVLASLITLALIAGFNVMGPLRWIGGGAVSMVFVVVGVTAPNLWVNFVTASLDVIIARGELVSVQAERVGADESLSDRAEMLVNQAFFAGSQYYEDPPWASYEPIRDEIAAYEGAHLDGRGGAVGWGVPLIGLEAGGVGWLWARRRAGSSLLMAGWLLILVVSLLANPLPWQRYYVILHAPLAVLAGLGLCQVQQWIGARSR